MLQPESRRPRDVDEQKSETFFVGRKISRSKKSDHRKWSEFSLHISLDGRSHPQLLRKAEGEEEHRKHQLRPKQDLDLHRKDGAANVFFCFGASNHSGKKCKNPKFDFQRVEGKDLEPELEVFCRIRDILQEDLNIYIFRTFKV